MPPPAHEERALARAHGQRAVILLEGLGAFGVHLQVILQRDIVFQGLDRFRRVEGHLAVLEQLAAVAPQDVHPHRDVLGGLRRVVHADADAFLVLDDLRHLGELVPGLRHREPVLLQQVLAVEHELGVAAQRQAVDHAAIGDPELVRGVVAVERDLVLRHHLVDGHEQILQPRPPVVLVVDEVGVGVARHLDGEYFLEKVAEGNELELDLDSRQVGELLQPCFVALILAGHRGQIGEFGPGIGLARLEAVGQRVGRVRKGRTAGEPGRERARQQGAHQRPSGCSHGLLRQMLFRQPDGSQTRLYPAHEGDPPSESLRPGCRPGVSCTLSQRSLAFFACVCNFLAKGLSGAGAAGTGRSRQGTGG